MEKKPFCFIGFMSKKRFGIELEVDKTVTQADIKKAISSVDKTRDVIVTGYSQTRNNSYWHVKTDSTCGPTGAKSDGGGWEVASYVARGFRDLASIGEVVSAISDCGAKVNTHCGMHIHVDVGNAGEYFYNLVADWLRIEHIMYQIVPYHRRDNVYCTPLKSKLQVHNSHITRDDLVTKIAFRTSHDTDRRVSFNTCNFVQGMDVRTVELRLPEGTVNAEDVKNWTRLFVHFITSSEKRARDERKAQYLLEVAEEKRAMEKTKINESKNPDTPLYDPVFWQEKISKRRYNYEEANYNEGYLKVPGYAPPQLLRTKVIKKIKKNEYDIGDADLITALHILGLHSKDSFAILSKYLLDTKVWFLKRLIKYSGDKRSVAIAKEILADIV